jgi:hypothetical protein
VKEHESPADENDPRRVQLVAAAEALVAWAHARRATWTSLPVDVRRTPDEVVPPTVNTPDEVVPATVTPGKAAAWLKSARHVRFLWELLIRRGRQVAIAAVVVAIVAIAGLGAYRYWAKARAAPKSGTAILDSVPEASSIVIDGTAAGSTPRAIELTPGRHVVDFRRGNATRRVEIEVAAGRATVERVDWGVALTGRLTVHSEPPGARVLIDGRAYGVTPLTVDDLTAGSHLVVLESDKGSVQRTVVVRADVPAEITESIYAGWLKLFAPFELQISEGKRAIRLDDRNQIILPPGPHDLQFENRALGYRETRRVDVLPGQVTSLSLVPPPSTLTVTATAPAEVLVDGARVGVTPLTNQPITIGTRDIIVRSAEGAERRFTITVTVMPVRINVDFLKP